MRGATSCPANGFDETARNTSTASDGISTNRVIAGSVTSKCPSRAAVARQRVSTDPVVPHTVPRRTEPNERDVSCEARDTIFSISAFVIPSTLVGAQALSLLAARSSRTLGCANAALTTLAEPTTFVRTASSGFSSHAETSFMAARWKTTSTPSNNVEANSPGRAMSKAKKRT